MWDKSDGYKVPDGRNLYNSYFFVVEDETVDPIKKFYYQGNGFATECDGGVANHVGLQEHLTKVSSYILSSSFHFNLTPDASEDPDKPVYSIGTTAEEFFAIVILGAI